jgi:hypothetical protein
VFLCRSVQEAEIKSNARLKLFNLSILTVFMLVFRLRLIWAEIQEFASYADQSN